MGGVLKSLFFPGRKEATRPFSHHHFARKSTRGFQSSLPDVGNGMLVVFPDAHAHERGVGRQKKKMFLGTGEGAQKYVALSDFAF